MAMAALIFWFYTQERQDRRSAEKRASEAEKEKLDALKELTEDKQRNVKMFQELYQRAISS